MSETATRVRRPVHYHRGTPVPFITAWEQEVQGAMQGAGNKGAMVKMVGTSPDSLLRVSYEDESPYDRDSHGVLWQRYPLAMYRGAPQFAKVHPARQRRCMVRRLCQVCGNPADVNEDGWLWLVAHQDAARLGAGGERRVRTANPPVCTPCSELARQKCPHLLKGHMLVRAAAIKDWGVYGLKATPDGASTGHEVAYGDPAAVQMIAGQQIVTIHSLTILA